MKHSYIHIIGVGLALVLATAGCGSKKTGDDAKSDTEQAKDTVEVRPEVTFATADGQPLYQYVESQGVVKAARQITLKPKISGYVKQSGIREGRWVKKGDTLLAFDPEEWQYARREAENTYQQKKSAYRIEKRQRRSLPKGDSTRSDRMVRIATGLAKAEVALNKAKLNLSYATLIAPFSGRLATEDRVTAGAYVPAGTELGQLVNDASVRIRFDVLESEINHIHTGLTVRVSSPGGKTTEGKVSALSPVVDTKSKTGQVTVRVANHGRQLHPGMTVDGRILVQKQTGKARIPRSAILSRDNGRLLVFKLHPDNNEVEWVYVSPAAENSDWAIINNPKISPGDTLAVDNNFALSHLQKVQPKMQRLNRKEGGQNEAGGQ